MVQRRFYDQEKTISKVVNLTRQLPEDFQSLIAEGITAVAIRDLQADQRLKHLKSLGAEKILPLYSSKNKRRDYDAVPAFHTAMNYLRVLEEAERNRIADSLMDLAEFIREYIEKCKYTALLPNRLTISKVRNNYLNLEQEKAAQYLKLTRQELLSTPIPEDSTRVGYVTEGSTLHLGEI